MEVRGEFVELPPLYGYNCGKVKFASRKEHNLFIHDWVISSTIYILQYHLLETDSIKIYLLHNVVNVRDVITAGIINSLFGFVLLSTI